MKLKLLGGAAAAFLLRVAAAGSSPIEFQNKYPIKDLEFSQPFLNHEFHNQNYELGGSTVLSKNTCKLTNDDPGQQGWLAAQRQMLPKNFQLDIEFEIYGDGKSMYGDGMAIWFLPGNDPIVTGPVMGLQDNFKGTAILIDTYRNHRPGKPFPYIMVMQNDGTRTYDADNDGLANELAGYSVRGLHSPLHPTLMRITYQDGGAFTVEVNFRTKWETCFSINLDLQDNRRLALSASTGQLSEVHAIRKIEAYVIPGLDEANLKRNKAAMNSPGSAGGGHYNQRVTPPKKSRGWLWFLFKLILFLSAILGGAKLYFVYQRKKTQGGSLGFY